MDFYIMSNNKQFFFFFLVFHVGMKEQTMREENAYTRLKFSGPEQPWYVYM